MRPFVVAAGAMLVASCGRAPAAAIAPAVEERLFANGPIAPRSTFCNPLDIDYRFATDTPSRRDVADPVIVLFGDEYYLFASRSGGYWRSHDMNDWDLVSPEGLPADDDAPAVFVLDGRMYYTATRTEALYATDDPAAGRWRKVAALASYVDPALFRDDDGVVHLYSRSADDGGISVVELDPRNGFTVMGAPHEVLRARGATHPSMTKHGGSYYLRYSALDSASQRLAARVERSQSATRDFGAAPFTSPDDVGGLLGRIGTATSFRDRAGNDWLVATTIAGGTATGERRLGIFPLGFDNAGTMRVDAWLGAYPQLLPGMAGAPFDHNGSGWMLLSAGKEATASSSMAGHPVTLALDEDASTWWSAASAGVGEWMSVDLGRLERVTAIQVNFAEQGTRALGRDEDDYQQYIIESSIDGTHWTTRVDESVRTRDRPHRYVQLDTARNARFVRITNVHAAAGGTFGIRELRVFGESTVARPVAAANVAVKRRPGEPRATISWTRSAGARAYIVRYGPASDMLDASREVRDATSLTIDGLEPAASYWFTVDAIGEGGVTRGRERTRG